MLMRRLRRLDGYVFEGRFVLLGFELQLSSHLLCFVSRPGKRALDTLLVGRELGQDDSLS